MLYEYAQQERQRWHMPGHKGLRPPLGDFLDWKFDVTEIKAMNEVPNPVQRSERLMAKTYGADHTWYSVQGATLPIMVAILASNPLGSTLWVDRSMHRSVLSALVIGGYQVRWMYPQVLPLGLGLPLTTFPEDFSGATGMVLTRPTYDGLAQHLGDVIGRAHAAGLGVVVDEAHGSHWIGPRYPLSAVYEDADFVVHGVHKSENTLTQTGLLHQRGERIDPREVDRWWRLLATSSPSYLLLGALDRLQQERHSLTYQSRWTEFGERVAAMWNRLSQQGIPTLQEWGRRHGFDVDPARLTFLGPGSEIAEFMQDWGEVEKVTPGSCSLLLSPDQDLSYIMKGLTARQWSIETGAFSPMSYPQLATAFTIRDALSMPGRWVPLEAAEGLVAKDALTPYPPGIPVTVPGEVITAELIEWLQHWLSTVPSPVDGITFKEGRQSIWVVDQ